MKIQSLRSVRVSGVVQKLRGSGEDWDHVNTTIKIRQKMQLLNDLLEKKILHKPFEFVAASAIFWNASKKADIAWMAVLKIHERKLNLIKMLLSDVVYLFIIFFFFTLKIKKNFQI